MDRYQRVEKPRPETTTISENEICITAQGLIHNYVTYATSLLQDKQVKEIALKGMGQAISKTVAITEVIKKKIPDLHQNIVISSLEMTRHVSKISIFLSTKELNKNSPGYQAPLHSESFKPQRYQQSQQYQQHQPRLNQGQIDSYGHGRGRGRGRERSWGNRGGYGGGYGGYGNNQGGYGGYGHQGGYGHLGGYQRGYHNQGGYGGYCYDQGGYGVYGNGWSYKRNIGGSSGRGRDNWSYGGPGYEPGGRGAGGPGIRVYARGGLGRMGGGRGWANQNY